jgi:hypothetical protein
LSRHESKSAAAFYELQGNGVMLRIGDDGRLKARHVEDVLTDDEKTTIKRHRAAIKAMITDEALADVCVKGYRYISQQTAGVPIDRQGQLFNTLDDVKDLLDRGENGSARWLMREACRLAETIGKDYAEFLARAERGEVTLEQVG